MILVDTRSEVEEFRVLAKGLAGSDHQMVVATVRVPFCERPQPELSWHYYRDVDWFALECELQVHLQVWLKWFSAAVASQVSGDFQVKDACLVDTLCVC